jgi:enoyl-CoA hydratase/carnithine racemase
MESLLLEIDRGVALITFNRPEKLNAFDPETIVRLAAAWDAIEADDQVRVAIMTGAGNRAFSIGADFNRLTPLGTGARAPEDDWDRKFLEPATGDRAMLRHQYTLSKPIIAAINGFCFAGACELMTATDIRIAAETSSFALQEARWALAPARGALARLPRQIPYCRAMEMMLTGSRFSAAEALQMGLINHVVPADQVLAKAREMADIIAANGPLAIKLIKQAAARMTGLPLAEAHQIEDEIFAAVMRSEDAREGPRSFLEKRKPVYKGR